MNHPWSDDIQDSPSHEMPDERYRPDRFLFLEDDSGESQDKKPDVSQCPNKITCLSDATKLFRNKFDSDRSFLIWIARYYLRIKLTAMEDIFRLDCSNLCRVSNKANKNIQKKG